MKGNLDLNYTSTSHAHTMTHIGSDTFNLIYDAENRLVTVTKGAETVASFTYDGDGQRVKAVEGSETIFFVGGHYELNATTSEITKYYAAGATRVAVRKYSVPSSSELTYLLGDHLGSTSLATDETGALLVETRYKAWGEVRYTTEASTLPTRYTFTGQYSYIADDATDLGSPGFGLMYYGARWYDVYLNHFTQPDSIVPDPYNSQSYDRYSYANNNPIRYTDPSGHVACDEWGNCFDHGQRKKINGQDPRYTILVCGWDGVGGCRGSESDLGNYTDTFGQTGADGTFDFDDCDPAAGKADCANKVYDYMLGKAAGNPFSEFTIIGHSAGADAAILAVDKVVRSGVPINIKGLVLLDPTLTSGKGHGFPDHSKEGSLAPLVLNILSSGVPVFVGAGAQADSQIPVTKYLDPLTVNGAEFAPYSNSVYSYNPYPLLLHPTMATDPDVMGDIRTFIK